MSKPNVLVLGGIGFIGRNLVQYLVENNLANEIRVVDKCLVSTANLGVGHAEAFNAPNVEVIQATLTTPGNNLSIFLFFIQLINYFFIFFFHHFSWS